MGKNPMNSTMLRRGNPFVLVVFVKKSDALRAQVSSRNPSVAMASAPGGPATLTLASVIVRVTVQVAKLSPAACR
jgi:hypothetical protein